MMVRNIPRYRSLTAGALLLACLLLVAGAALGQDTGSKQTRSKTGRHQPAAAVDTVATVDGKKPPAPRVDAPWTFGFSVGAQGGSDLFQAQTISGIAVPWTSGDREAFTSSRFKADLATNIGFGMYGSKHLGSRWFLRGDLSYSAMDITAQALQGQTGAVFVLDRADVVTLGLGIEGALISTRSYPFFTAGALVRWVTASNLDGFDQVQPGGQLGLGYSQHLQQKLSLRIMARYSMTPLSLDDFVPESSLVGPEDIEVQAQDSLQMFELMLAVHFDLGIPSN